MSVLDLRPAAGEASSYHQPYIDLLGDQDILEVLAHQIDETGALLEGPAAGKGDYAYAPGKWTVKEVVLHLADAERVFGYRALRFSRGDTTPLPGYEQDDYTPESGASGRTLGDLMEEFRTVRAATLSLVRSFTPQTLLRRGTASGNTYSVRALAAIIAGHERHHLRVLRERYL